MEYVRVLRTRWTDEVASFDGEFYPVPPSRLAPRPVQPGGPAGRAAAEWLGSQGVTELYYDLDRDPEIGNPDVPAESATERAAEIIDALAPEYA